MGSNPLYSLLCRCGAMVAQRTCNAKVVSSILTIGSIIKQ